MSEMDINNKVALVTGAARGIGFAYVTELLTNGAKHVVIVDLEKSGGKELAANLNKKFGEGRASFIAVDVTKADEFEAAFVKVVDEFGGLDILVNNAGVVNEVRWEYMIEVNVNAVIRGTLLGLQYMGKDKGGNGGVIVNISSIYGLDTTPYSPIYVATKHAVLGFSRSFGLPFHFDRTGVRVLTMCPGITDTVMISEAGIKLMDFADLEVAVQYLKDTCAFQKPENVAEGVVNIIKSAPNGTVWLSEGEEPVHEILIPDRFALKAPVEK